MAYSRLDIHRRNRGERTLVTPAGDIGPATTPLLRAAVEQCLLDGVTVIDIDLTTVGSCDVPEDRLIRPTNGVLGRPRRGTHEAAGCGGRHGTHGGRKEQRSRSGGIEEPGDLRARMVQPQASVDRAGAP
ncbi:hypothetical protein AB5J52_19940 [Streptomyces sp. R39]|uniref:Uncharacterized protein n=1 Tax=Streptomyces sp. R39 TaxID=3238631 RepID=A0AB39QPQ6_9ACTN